MASEPLIERDENVCDRGRDRAPQVVPVPKIGLPALNHLGHEAGPEVGLYRALPRHETSARKCLTGTGPAPGSGSWCGAISAATHSIWYRTGCFRHYDAHGPSLSAACGQYQSLSGQITVSNRSGHITDQRCGCRKFWQGVSRNAGRVTGVSPRGWVPVKREVLGAVGRAPQFEMTPTP